MPDLRRIDLNLLVALNVLLEERSVSRAAQRLSLTQPTVSGMLARMRALFGDPLFVRGRGGIVPTARARALAPELRRWLADAERIVVSERFDPARASATFRIATTDYMLEAVIAPLAAVLRARAPGIRLAVLPLAIAELASQLGSEQLDLAVTIPRFAAPALPSRRLYRERYVGVTGAKHPLAARTPSLDEFCRHPHLLVSPTGGAFEGPVDEALARVGRKREVAMSIPSFLAVRSMLPSLELVAVLPERLIDPSDRRLRVFELPIELPGFDVIATWHPRWRDDPAHRWLRELLHSVAARGRKARGDRHASASAPVNR